jgi:hypothetical protein
MLSRSIDELQTMTHDEFDTFQATGSDINGPRQQQTSSIDSQLLRTLSSDGRYNEVTNFLKANNLAHRFEFFEKAAALLQSEDGAENIPNIAPFEIEALHNETQRKWSQPWTLYFTIFVCSFGAIEQGTAQTSMNGANLYFPKQFGIGSDSPRDKFLVGLINSGIYLSVGVL